MMGVAWLFCLVWLLVGVLVGEIWRCLVGILLAKGGRRFGVVVRDMVDDGCFWVYGWEFSQLGGWVGDWWVVGGDSVGCVDLFGIVWTRLAMG